MTIAELRQAVLRLPIEQRAALAEEIIASLPPDAECQLPDEWLDEICARSDALHAGTAELSDWRESLQRVRSALAKRRA